MNTGLVIISLCACKCYSLRCLPQKGRTKEHVIVQPNPTLPYHPHPLLPLNRLNVHLLPFFFSLFFFHFECSTFITSHPMPLPTIHPFFYFSSPLPPCSSSTTFASPSSPSLLSLRLSLSLFFLCSSLNYWKQNGLKTKTQADVA